MGILSVRSRIRSLESFEAPSHASTKQTGEKSQAEGPQLGAGRVRLAKRGQDGSATTVHNRETHSGLLSSIMLVEDLTR